MVGCSYIFTFTIFWHLHLCDLCRILRMTMRQVLKWEDWGSVKFNCSELHNCWVEKQGLTQRCVWAQIHARSTRSGVSHPKWQTSSVCNSPGWPPPRWVDLVLKKTGVKRMLGLRQTQLCQWTSFSKCLFCYDIFFPLKDGLMMREWIIWRNPFNKHLLRIYKC